MNGKLLIAVFLISLGAQGSTVPNVSMCPERSAEIVKGWKAKNNWKEKAIAEKKVKMYISPTEKFGRWVIVKASEEKTELSLVDANNTIAVVLGKSCKGKVATYPSKKVTNKKKFVLDVEVEQLLAKNKKGLIYAWSPHMPLSISGIKNIIAVAKKLNLPIHFVLDPNAGEKSVEKAKEKIGRGDFYRRNRSVELLMRNFDMHYPVVALYQNKNFSKYIKYGYETEAMFYKEIKGALK